MSQQIINTGTEPGAGDGDDLYTAFDKVNQNFTEIYSGNVLAANIVVYSVAGRTGNVELTVQDVLGAASTGNITSLQQQMSANSAADRAYTDAAVASLSSVSNINITGGTLSNVHITGHSWGNLANLNVLGSITASGALVADGISSTDNIVATNDINVGGVLRFADLTEMSTAVAPVDLTSTNLAITTNTNRVAAANVEIANLRANVTAANATITINTNRVAAANVEIANLRANIDAANATISSLSSSIGANAAGQALAINSLNANLTAANAVISTLQSNAAAQGSLLDTLTSNAATQSADIAALQANVSAANAAIVSDANKLINGANEVVLHSNANVTVPGGMHFIAPENSNISIRSTGTLGNTHIEWHDAADRATVKYSKDGVEVFTTSSGVQRSWKFHPDGSTHFPQYVFPLGPGAAGQYLETDGLGVLTWVTPGVTDLSGVNANVTAANAAISALQSNAGTQGTEINSLRSNITAANSAITSLTANAAAQSSLIDAVNANVIAANAAIVSLQSNAAGQATALSSLEANAITQESRIVLVNANVTAANAEISALKVSVATNAALVANAASQAVLINELRANITASNVRIGTLESTVDLQTQDIAQLETNAAVQQSLIVARATIANPTFTGTVTTPILVVTSNATVGNISATKVTATQIQGNLVNIPSINAIGNISGGNIIATQGTFTYVQGTLISNAQPFVTSLGNLTVLDVDGNLTADRVITNEVRGTLYNGPQPGISSVGTLLSLNVSGNITTQSNTLIANSIQANSINTGGNATIGNATIGNVTVGNVSVMTNLAVAGHVTISNSLSTAANLSANNVITNTVVSSGEISALRITALANSVLGNIQTNTVTATSLISSSLTGTLTTNAQPNITSVGTLSALSVSGNAIVSDNLYVTGNLFVAGNSTIVNSENVTTNELTLTLANNAPNALAANGAGITIANLGAKLYYDSVFDLWVSTRGIFTPFDILANGNVTVANSVTAQSIYGNINASQANIISLNALSSLTVTGNVSAGNVITARADVTSIRFPDDTVQTTSANSAISAYVSPINSNVAAANLEIGSLQSNITAANLEIGSLQSNITAANIEIGNLQGNISAANVEIGNLQGNISAANVEIGNVQANVTAANIEIGNVQANVTAANIEIGNLQANVTAANIEIGNLQGNISAANIEIGNVQANVTAANVEIGNVQANVTAANVEIGNVQANVTAANVEIGNVQANVTAANVEIGNVQANVTAANIEIGNVQANITAANAEILLRANISNPTFTGNLDANIINATGNVTVGNISGGKATFTELELPTVTFAGNVTGGNLVTAANVYADNVLATNTVYADQVITVGNTTAGNLVTLGKIQSVLVSTSGNVESQSWVVGPNAKFDAIYGPLQTPNQPGITKVGTLQDLDILGNINSVDWVVSSAGGIFTEVTGLLKTNAQPNITSVGTLANLDVAGNIVTNANLTVTANLSTGNVSGTTAVFTEVQGIVLTNAQPYITSIGTLQSLNVSGNIETQSNLVVANTISSVGNISTSGNIITAFDVYANNVVLTGAVNLTGNATASNLSVGNVTASGNITSQGNIETVGNISAGNVAVSGNISAAGISITGGAGVINLGTGTLTAGQLNGNLLASNVDITATTESISTITGALTVAGGTGIGANLNVGGNLNVAANARISTNLVVAGDLTTGNANIGSPDGTNFVFGVTNFKGTTLESDNSAIALFTTTINQIEFGLAAQDIEIGAYAGGTTQINHDVVVIGNILGNLGNASPGSNVYVGTNLAVRGFAIANNSITANANVTSRLSVDNPAASLNAQSGALTVTGGIGVLKNISVGVPGAAANANIIVYGTAVSTSTTSGALQVRGGTGLSANLYVGGVTHITNTFTTTSATTGALRVSGGTGVAGNLHVGGNVVIDGDFIVFGTPTLPSISIGSLNNTPVGNAVPSSGSFTTLTLDSDYMRPRSKPSLLLDFANGRKLDGRITYAGPTYATYVNKAGYLADIISTAPYAGTQPRFTHNSNGECLGLLIEEQRTNYLQGSESFQLAGTSYWETLNSAVVGGTTSGNIGPRGSTTGVTYIQEDSNTGIHGVAVKSDVLYTTTLATVYTASVFARKGTRDQLAIIFDGEGTPTVFDLNFGNITAEGTTYRSSMETYANGWYRCLSTVAKTNTSGNVTIAMASGGSTTYTGDGASTLEIFGAQLEEGTFGTSYISTLGSSQTRAADNVSITAVHKPSWLEGNNGTVLVDGSIGYRPTDLIPQNTRGVFFSLEDGTAGNRVQVLAETRSAPTPYRAANLVVVTGGTVQANIGGSGNLITSSSGRVSAFFSPDAFGFSFNANTVVTDVAGTMGNIYTLFIGKGSGGTYLNGCVSKIQFYPTVRSTSEIQTLTRQ